MKTQGVTRVTHVTYNDYVAGCLADIVDHLEHRGTSQGAVELMNEIALERGRRLDPLRDAIWEGIDRGVLVLTSYRHLTLPA